jgi:hypothetical protein
VSLGEIDDSNNLYSYHAHSTITFQTIERSQSKSVELGTATQTLFTKAVPSGSNSISPDIPSKLEFSIPLMADTPQSFTTPHSSITHSLTATLHSSSGSAATSSLTKTIPVQITRYSSPSPSSNLPLSPVEAVIDSPVRITFQVPRTVFRVGEPVPVYITIPPPPQSVVEGGLRLRNVKAELVRVVKIGDLSGTSDGSDDEGSLSSHDEHEIDVSTSEKISRVSSNGAFSTSTILSRSGSSCRFHSSKPIRIRLVLHDSGPSASPSSSSSSGGTITQSTVIHDISFHLRLTASFTTRAPQAASTSSIFIPVIIVPPQAPPHESGMDGEIEVAYRKKHDPPPVKTTRSAENPTGGSPPPFDENIGSFAFDAPPTAPDPSAPPPFFSPEPSSSALPSFAASVLQSQSEPSTSQLPPMFSPTGDGPSDMLPSFSESQSQAVQAAFNNHQNTRFSSWVPSPAAEGESGGGGGAMQLHFAGEGEEYGFRPEEQYDGISYSEEAFDARPSTPPPAIASSARDRDVTSFVGVIDNLRMAASQEAAAAEPRTAADPPPPPPMDDPSDPPPSIDEGIHSLSSEERARRDRAMEAAHASQGDLEANAAAPPPPRPIVEIREESGRPPPYLNDGVIPSLVAGGEGPAVSVPSGPPPYVDLR